uniref:Uncharacterized protein n=1 Tax=Arundo donax TaxID=35708 RepID=A0A0A9ED82_ARUDO
MLAMSGAPVRARNCRTGPMNAWASPVNSAAEGGLNTPRMACDTDVVTLMWPSPAAASAACTFSMAGARFWVAPPATSLPTET